MATKKHFLQDRTALLLVSGNAFLTLAAIVLTIVWIKSLPATSTYIIQCRNCTDTLDINRFSNGSVSHILSFILFAILVFGFSLMLSYKAYRIKRELSLAILGLTLPLLIFAIVVVNQLLIR